MSVVFQLAGQCRPNIGPRLREAFAVFRESFQGQPGFERALLLANYTTLQFQILTYWASFEEGLAYERNARVGAMSAFRELIEPGGELIASRLSAQLAASPS